MQRDHCFHTVSKGPSLKHAGRMGFGCFGNTVNLSTPFLGNVQKPYWLTPLLLPDNISVTCPTDLHTIGLNESGTLCPLPPAGGGWEPCAPSPSGWEPCAPFPVGGAGSPVPFSLRVEPRTLPPSLAKNPAPLPNGWVELGTLLLPSGWSWEPWPPPRKRLSSQLCVERTFASPTFLLFPEQGVFKWQPSSCCRTTSLIKPLPLGVIPVAQASNAYPCYGIYIFDYLQVIGVTRTPYITSHSQQS